MITLHENRKPRITAGGSHATVLPQTRQARRAIVSIRLPPKSIKPR